MNINNQKDYWNEVAEFKTFTHPIDIAVLEKNISRQSKILDFGCGYGRIVNELLGLGYENVLGYDTSIEIIKRGKRESDVPIFHIDNPSELDIEEESIDCILLFAVLTCIPSNEGQLDLIRMLYSKLRQGGIIYISDYYVQEHALDNERYQYLYGDKNNFGVFSLPEGVIFRHHTKEWISELTKDFEVLSEKSMDVFTMNGNKAKGFQLLGRK